MGYATRVETVPVGSRRWWLSVRSNSIARPVIRVEAPPILTVSLRRSVGSTWTLVLEADEVSTGPVAWISSGVPISEPPPRDVAGLLEEHGYRYLPSQADDDRLSGRPNRRLGFAWRTGDADASTTYPRLC